MMVGASLPYNSVCILIHYLSAYVCDVFVYHIVQHTPMHVHPSQLVVVCIIIRIQMLRVLPVFIKQYPLGNSKWSRNGKVIKQG